MRKEVPKEGPVCCGHPMVVYHLTGQWCCPKCLRQALRHKAFFIDERYAPKEARKTRNRAGARGDL